MISVVEPRVKAVSVKMNLKSYFNNISYRMNFQGIRYWYLDTAGLLEFDPRNR